MTVLAIKGDSKMIVTPFNKDYLNGYKFTKNLDSITKEEFLEMLKPENLFMYKTEKELIKKLFKDYIFTTEIINDLKTEIGLDGIVTQLQQLANDLQEIVDTTTPDTGTGL